MMESVELPNGNVIENVPVDATDDQIMQEAIRLGLASAEDFPAPAQPVGEEDYLGSGVIEPAKTLVSGMVAEPVSGLAGLGAMGVNEIFNFFRGGGRDSTEVALETMENVRDAMTDMPETQSGIANMQAIGEFMEPVTETIESIEQGAGDVGYEQAGVAGGVIGKTAPTALMTAMGLRPFRNAVKTASGFNRVKGAVEKASEGHRVRKAISEGAPSARSLKDQSSNLYQALDDSGAVVKSDLTDSLATEINQAVTKAGYHPRMHQSVAVALDEFGISSGQDLPIGRIDQLRKFAQTSASSIDPPTKNLGVIMINKIDDFMNKLEQKDFKSGGGDVGEQYQLARELWGRGKRSELLTNAMTKASDQASGFENGMRIQFRHILNSDKKRKFFSPDEIKEMRRVVKGSAGSNIAQFIGKFGFDIGRTPNIVGGSIGAYAGGSLLGAGGAVVIPAVGTVSRQLAKHLTKGNADFANAVVRAGKNGKAITREYLSRVPKADQTPQMLAELLQNPDVSLEALRNMPMTSLPKAQKILIKDAVIYADLMRQGQQPDEGEQ